MFDDVKVVSLGDVPLAGHNAIGLFTMHEPLEDHGRKVAEEALRCISEPGRPFAHRVLTVSELRPRPTTIGNRPAGRFDERPSAPPSKQA